MRVIKLLCTLKFDLLKKIIYMIFVLVVFFQQQTTAQIWSTDSSARIFFVYESSQNFQQVRNYFQWLLNPRNMQDSLGNFLRMNKDSSVTIIANEEIDGYFDTPLDFVLEKEKYWIDSIVLRKSYQYVEEGWVPGGYWSDEGKFYPQASIKMRDEGDNTLVVQVFVHRETLFETILSEEKK